MQHFKNVNNLDFLYGEVNKKDTSEVCPNYHVPRHRSKVVVREEDNYIFEYFSPGYNLVTNQSFFAPIKAGIDARFGSEFIKTEVTTSHNGGSTTVDFILDDPHLIGKSDDQLFPMISATNSYDGTARQGITIGLYRLIYTNGLRAFQKGSTILNSKHTKWESKDLVSATSLLIGKLEELDTRLIEDLKLKKHSQKEVDLMIEAAISKKYPKMLIPKVHDSLGHEIDLLGEDANAWLVYNALNKALFESQQSMPMNERIRIDANMLQLVQ